MCLLMSHPLLFHQSPSLSSKSNKGYGYDVWDYLSYSYSMPLSYSMLQVIDDDYYSSKSSKGSSNSSKSSKGSNGCVDETMPSQAPSVSLAPSTSASPTRIVCFAARPSNPPSYSPTYEPSYFPSY
jgi:hypothetical protein